MCLNTVLNIVYLSKMSISTAEVTKDQKLKCHQESLNKQFTKIQANIIIEKSNSVSIDMIPMNHENIHSLHSRHPQHTYKATVHTNPPSYLILMTNELFNARILIFLITIFLFLLSLCYTFGQILSVEIGNFWCPRVTLSEVRAHSKEINSNEGVNDSCWTTKLNIVNFNLFLHLTVHVRFIARYGSLGDLSVI